MGRRCNSLLPGFAFLEGKFREHVRSWHLADIQRDLIHVAFEGKADIAGQERHVG